MRFGLITLPRTLITLLVAGMVGLPVSIAGITHNWAWGVLPASLEAGWVGVAGLLNIIDQARRKATEDAELAAQQQSRADISGPQDLPVPPRRRAGAA